MVLGCTSTAGKSLLVTALCRWFARRGVDVAPYKAQNMSNNARVVDGGEIGVAQWLQARAAGLEPTVDMNPVLLKPEADTRSQVVLAGRSNRELTEMPWRERGPYLWPAMIEAYHRLQQRHELVILEGAGSPAEINLPDQVNNRIVDYANANALLVVDIDRGGAFAHLVGTWSLVPESTRARLAGFVLNKFRGDPTLLAPGPEAVVERTGMADVGVLPMLAHELPDEEGATVRATPPADAPTVAIVRAPYGSNLDEWYLLARVAHVRWVTTPGELDGTDMIVLPGSKHVAADLAWMRQRGLDGAVARCAAAGTRVLGVCGGAMMLGAAIDDPGGVEGAADGLGVLPLRTTMDPEKTTRHVRVVVPTLPGPWSAFAGLTIDGYEIRNGAIDGADCELSPLMWGRGAVLATTVHGIAESPEFLTALTGIAPPAVLDDTFDQLADAIDEHLDTGLIDALTRQ
ncbi:MAG: cobyric acid synthase [Actinomycetota bacterium]